MIRPSRTATPNSAVALILSEAALLFSCYLFAAYLTLDVPLEVFLFDQGGYWHIGFVMAVIMLGLYFNDLYEKFYVRSRIQLLQQFCMVVGLAFLLQSLLAYGQWGALLPKWVMVYGSGLALVVLPLWRMFFTTLLWKSGGQKVLFLGSSEATREIAARMAERPDFGLTAIGFLDASGTGGAFAGVPRLGALADLDEVLAERQPARIVVGMSRSAAAKLPVERLLELRLAGLQIEDASKTYETLFGRVSTRDTAPQQLIFSKEMGPRGGDGTPQSIYSLVLASIALIPALPVMALIALVLKFGSPGTVLSRKRCSGRNGVAFDVYKFRSTGGQWLRRLRLDELPQLFNVLRGDMWMVGPRPERPEFIAQLEELIPYYRQRLSVKPGVTGWAQINESHNEAVEDTIAKIEFDRYYIKNRSIALDAFILFYTLKVTLAGQSPE